MGIEELILGYEMDFFKKAFCENIQNLENRVHDEFIEIGRSGLVYDKDSIIHYLNNISSDRDIDIQEFTLKEVKEDIIMVNYTTIENLTDIKALRTSIWLKEKLNWKLFFHQGTPTEVGK